MPFVKLDKSILTSTIWLNRPDLLIFVTALLMAEPCELKESTPTIKIDSLQPDDFVVPPGWYGFVRAAGPGIVRASYVDITTGMEAIHRLASPEPDSRSQEFEGRRMVRINGGYIVLNFMRYRDYDHSAAERMRKLRERKKKSVQANDCNVTPNSSDVRCNVTYSREQKTEDREQNKEEGQTVPKSRAVALPDDEWIASLSSDPAFRGIEVSREASKCRLWCQTNKKTFSRRRLLNWLMRCEAPISGTNPPSTPPPGGNPPLTPSMR